jgi:hypothetical protein
MNKYFTFHPLKRKTKLYLFCFFFILGAHISTAQSTLVTGNVTSADDKSSLPGVSIIVKGTTQGVVTDADGNYSINAPANSTLVFSFIGYISEEVAVNNQTKIDVDLIMDIQELSQVVVVGYGTQKKSDVTGAISSVSKEDIANVRSANVVESMQGKVAGVDMSRAGGRAGAGYNILVRGTKSLTASNDPLYIVDGIQYTSNVDINPSDSSICADAVGGADNSAA